MRHSIRGRSAGRGGSSTFVPGVRPAFTMVEATVCTLLVGLLFVAAMNSIGASRSSQFVISAQVRGHMLAEQVMAEIMQQAYEEPEDTVEFGRESESGGDRLEWDDVDDYDKYKEKPPEFRNGDAMPGFDDWKREISVVWVDPMTLDEVTDAESGVKRISVRVSRHGKGMCKLMAYRADVDE